jgi:phospholipase C
VPSDRLSRRDFVVGSAAVVGSLAFGRRIAAPAGLPPPARSGIDHIVVVMMENRSFDHFLGWMPKADGRQAGLTYTDAAGATHSTYPLAPDFQGCAHPDPDHSYNGGRVQYNNGACDGFLRSGRNDVYAIGYYRQRDLAFLGRAAPYWTVCDRYFAALMGPTFPNRLYMHAAVTDRITNTFSLSTLPTIWDRLAERGISRRMYYSNLPTLALWGSKYASVERPFNEFLRDCKNGKLPKVAFVDPVFTGTDEGTAGDDHPHADIRVGEWFLSRIYRAVTTSRNWARTVLIINFDEWGGFFDHVPPPLAQDVDPRYTLRGFRVPCLVISPYARRRYVAHGIYDHTSILKMIEWRWNLQPLSVRDANANNIANVLDFKHRNLTAPRITAPFLVGQAC